MLADVKEYVGVADQRRLRFLSLVVVAFPIRIQALYVYIFQIWRSIPLYILQCHFGCPRNVNLIWCVGCRQALLEDSHARDMIKLKVKADLILSVEALGHAQPLTCLRRFMLPLSWRAMVKSVLGSGCHSEVSTTRASDLHRRYL